MSDCSIVVSDDMIRRLFLDGIGGVLRELLELILNQLLESRAKDKCNAGHYEQTEERTDYRNGHRERAFTTRLGKLCWKCPGCAANRWLMTCLAAIRDRSRPS